MGVGKALQDKNRLQQSAERITMLGGAFVDRDQAQELKDRRQSSAIRLKNAIEKIHSYGCVVKDLDIGLVDLLNTAQKNRSHPLAAREPMLIDSRYRGGPGARKATRDATLKSTHSSGMKRL